MTRDEAVGHLQSRGLTASVRDWAMGRTIGVFAGPTESAVGTVYRRAAYLVPREEGWVVVEMRDGPPDVDEPQVMSLEDACVRAEAILSTPPNAR